ncbi:MAG: Asp-tRNA(Asn)/Glu-tRNA(Gln) amidotransferase subunit GatA [Patescibacteria group bacterium]|nr:Asp-tRNA(Asn)/Glu-tRNA(Gln) amidotransferase subunit GatA [Patescibacteria group bacterium]
MSFNQLTIKEAINGLKKKKFSCQELAKDCLKEIEKRDKEINAFISLNEKIIEEAREIDKKMMRGEKLGELAGIPLAIKDNILVKGLRCTAGSKMLENYFASYNATVIEKLKKEDALIIGKTNLDEFAMGSSGEYSAFGFTRNPYDLKRVAGGSSSGSAAAVAANFCLGALGSDTGGSIRQPAAFCGLVGLKPTYGSVSRYGLIATASSLDQIGPITKTVEDCQLIFEIIRGRDEFDSTSMEINSKVQRQKLTVGLPREYFAEGPEREIKDKIKEIVKKLEDQRIEIKEVSLPHTDYALSCYYVIMPSEVSANLARYDGIRYGRLNFQSQMSSLKSVFDLYLKNRSEGFGDEVKRRIMLGTYSLSAGYFEAYYLKAMKVRNLIKDDFEKVFKQVDLIITPTTPTTAFKIGEKQKPLEMYLSDIFTVPTNLAGLPALSLPIGFSSEKLPLAMQIIGPSFSESEIFRLAKLVEGLK